MPRQGRGRPPEPACRGAMLPACSRSGVLCQRATSMPRAGASFEGNCPFEGEGKTKAALAAGVGVSGRPLEPESRGATLSARLP